MNSFDVQPYLEVLSSSDSTDEERVQVCCTLKRNLGIHDPDVFEESLQHTSFRECGGIQLLVRILVQQISCDKLVVLELVDCLQLLSLNFRNNDIIRESHGIQPLVTLLSDDNCILRLQATKIIGDLVDNENSDNQNAVRENGGMPLLLSLLADDEASVRAQAARTVGLLCKDNPVNKEALSSTSGGTPSLVQLLSDFDEKVRNEAVVALLHVVDDCPANKDAVLAVGGVKQIVLLLSNNSSISTSIKASVTLGRLAINHRASQKAIRIAGGVSSLVVLLDALTCDEDTEAADKRTLQREVVKTLFIMAQLSPINLQAIQHSNGVIPLLAIVSDANTSCSVCEQATYILHRLAFSRDPSTKESLRALGLASALQRQLSHTNANVRRSAVCALAGLVAETRVSAGIVTSVVPLLSDPEAMVRADAILSLQTIAEGYVENGDILCTAQGGEAVVDLVRLLADPEESVRKIAAAAVYSIIGGRVANQDIFRRTGGILSLIRLLSDASQEICAQSCWALITVVANHRVNQDAVAMANGIPPLVRLLECGVADVQEPAIIALYSLTAYHAENQEAIRIEGGIIPLVQLLSSRHAVLRDHAAWAMACLAWEHPVNQQSIAQAGGIQRLEVLSSSENEETIVRDHAALALRQFDACFQTSQHLQTYGGA